MYIVVRGIFGSDYRRETPIGYCNTLEEAYSVAQDRNKKDSMYYNRVMKLEELKVDKSFDEKEVYTKLTYFIEIDDNKEIIDVKKENAEDYGLVKDIAQPKVKHIYGNCYAVTLWTNEQSWLKQMALAKEVFLNLFNARFVD